jgi:exosome complex component CSL4
MRHLNEKTREEGAKFVFPGERLGVIEEFLPGRGTYVEEGNIYSSTLGYLRLDKVRKEAQIQSKARTPLTPRPGDVVIGRVTSVQDKTMSIKMFQINDKVMQNEFVGVMHISNVSRSYVKSLSNVFKFGDLIRARVISTLNNEYHLTTQENNLGVLLSACSQCGSQLVLKNRRLRCPSCQKGEQSVIAADYGELT